MLTVTCKPRPLLPAWVSEAFFFFWSFKFKPCKEEEIMERYEIVKDIGSGNFGVAKLVRDKWTRELLAVKFIERGQKVWEYWIGLIFLSGLPSFPLGSLFLVDWGVFLVLQIDEHVQREIMNHRSLKHPNIVRFKEVWF